MNYFESAQSFTVSIHSAGSPAKEFEILLNSDKHRKFINWLESNTEGWKHSLSTYFITKIVMQGQFKMIILPDDSVIINYIEKGKPKEFFKKVKTGELDFLFEDL